MTERSERPTCLQCNEPADVLVSESEPYCAKHGLPILKQRSASQWNTTLDTRSTRYASGHDYDRA